MRNSGVLRRDDPVTGLAPLVFDSPHSGVEYPADFRFAAPFDLLRTAEDTWVDELFAAAPTNGATLLAAEFPRSYIDVNRELRDIDPLLLDGAWPGEMAPGEKTMLGIGLIRRLARPGIPVYDRKLSVAEIKDRITNYYQPYHDALAQILDGRHRHFGAVWHIDCHSMASTGSAMTPDGAVMRADFVIGDRDGTTCGRDFTDLVVATLRGFGYDVRVNDPYKGVEILRRYGRPCEARHSLQVEINRKLYMNETTRAKHDGFARLQRHLEQLIATLAGFATAKAAKT
jgi:N-formylglutamate deformylase